jgi:hypothetical protein
MAPLYLNGSIGYTFLVKKNIKILILADMHSKLPYCKENGVFISDWFKIISKYFKNTNNYLFLLEEVPRTGIELKELWPSSPHTQKLKDLYINNSHIIQGLDIRPLILPFSWELASQAPDTNLKEYLNLVDLFFTLNLKFINDDLKFINTTTFLKKNNLGLHYINVKKKARLFIKTNKNYLFKNIKELININNNLLEQINEITSEIMEWYSIAKIIQGINEKKTSIILHAGLAHTTNIIKLLEMYYGYNIETEFGLTDMSDIENNNINDNNISGCLYLPFNVEKQIIGGNLFGFLC